MEITETRKKSVITKKHETIIGYECDVCGAKSISERVPDTWATIRVYYDAGYGDTLEYYEHACSPACYFKIVAYYAHSCAETVDDHDNEFIRELVKFIEPLYAKGELGTLGVVKVEDGQ